MGADFSKFQGGVQDCFTNSSGRQSQKTQNAADDKETDVVELQTITHTHTHPLTHSHAQTHSHTRTHARTHTHTHTDSLSLSLLK